MLDATYTINVSYKLPYKHNKCISYAPPPKKKEDEKEIITKILQNDLEQIKTKFKHNK
jgi:hypothetical protein